MSKRKLGSIWGHRTPGKERSEKHLAKEGVYSSEGSFLLIARWPALTERAEAEGRGAWEDKIWLWLWTCTTPTATTTPQQWPWPQLSQWWYNKVRDLWCVLHWPGLWWILCPKGASLVVQWERICLPLQEARAQSLDGEDPLEKEMATHSSIPAWETPWTDEPRGL